MKNILSPTIIKIANHAAQIPGIKTLLKPIYYPYKRHLDNKRRNKFLTHGNKILKLFKSIMDNNKIPFVAAYGTMLGAVREHGFIKHDLDIDVFIWNNVSKSEVNQIMKENGFILDHIFMVNDGENGYEATYVKDDVSIDIFYLYEDENGNMYSCDYGPVEGTFSWKESMKKYGRVTARKIYAPVSTDRIEVEFNDFSIYVPTNYDEFLSIRYGDDYMTPNPKWVNKEQPNIVEYNSVNIKYTEFNN